PSDLVIMILSRNIPSSPGFPCFLLPVWASDLCTLVLQNPSATFQIQHSLRLTKLNAPRMHSFILSFTGVSMHGQFTVLSDYHSHTLPTDIGSHYHCAVAFI